MSELIDKLTSDVFIWKGQLSLNQPELVKGPFRAAYVASGAATGHKITFGAPTDRPGAKETQLLDRNGKVIIRPFMQAYLSNTTSLPDGNGELVVHFHRGSVGVAQVEKDRQHALAARSVEDGITVNVGSNRVITNLIHGQGPLDDLLWEREELFWTGAIYADQPFHVTWEAEVNSGSTAIVAIAGMASQAVGANYHLTLDSGLWDYAYNGVGVPAVPIATREGYLPMAFRNRLRIYNTGGTPLTGSWTVGTRSK